MGKSGGPAARALALARPLPPHTAPPTPLPPPRRRAFYDFYAYEPDINSAGVPETILGELFRSFQNGSYSPALPVKMFMLDAYWMYNERSNGNCK